MRGRKSSQEKSNGNENPTTYRRYGSRNQRNRQAQEVWNRQAQAERNYQRPAGFSLQGPATSLEWCGCCSTPGTIRSRTNHPDVSFIYPPSRLR
ncbi:hypothetical protein NDU88_004746 [Pleurodeles waltl]|uniref:Uncharacterized protein n=1 Tax=Pleurodeles waltl TaxID=8319 RepID=A0AAV7NKP1_PLEWA|nr:hypothetical protein NDU88_004746 [Pleurodeles waltl]